jgi:hypothetical protein
LLSPSVGDPKQQICNQSLAPRSERLRPFYV